MTKHADGSLFWPSMSSDGKTIVYEDNFGIWKLDVATRPQQRDQDRSSAPTTRTTRSSSARVSDEVDSFDISPSGRRAVDLGARADPDHCDRSRRHHARQSGSHGVAQPVPEVVGRRQATSRSCPDRSGRDEIWISDPEGRSPKKITDLDNEKNAPIWSPDSKSLLYIAGGKQLHNYTR